jgi:hypothetical protein
VRRRDGTSAVFTAYSVDRYDKSAFPTEQVYGDTDDAELRLITCGGDFDRGTGQYRDNVVWCAPGSPGPDHADVRTPGSSALPGRTPRGVRPNIRRRCWSPVTAG